VIDDSELTTLARVDMPVESKGVSLSLFRFLISVFIPNSRIIEFLAPNTEKFSNYNLINILYVLSYTNLIILLYYIILLLLTL